MGTPSSGSVSSADRTTIAFDRYGDGRPVILIGGAYNDRSTVGLPTAVVEGMRAAPVWGWLTALAPTLPYDVAVHHGYRLPTGRLAELELPLLALEGSESFPWIRAK